MRIVNTYTPHLPVYGQGSDCHGDIRLMIVLTQDENEKFAAYMGLADFSQGDGDARRQYIANCIAGGGHKMSYHMTKSFYPFLPEEWYRH